MPLGSLLQPQIDNSPYFDSLADLDVWASSIQRKLDGVLKYRPRRSVNDHRGKLLVCHDYKGGYTESPRATSYTFNFWSSVDTFVYFSHHRVTIPPPGWISAAHRQGVKILGTLIFEGSGEEDSLRLLVGSLPKSNTGPVPSSSSTSLAGSIPLSPHYARVLADLAFQRGFDGYLLNFECPLRGGMEQTRVLAAWNTLLQSELLSKVGPQAQTVWYDSVIITGALRWQDRLNSLNLPFFLSSTSIFTNYTWNPLYPNLTAQYFLTIDPEHINRPNASPKSLQDIFMGVDVWGRGSHGGGGLGSYRAITHVAPESLGLSVALFGQAWTWESEQDKPGWSWDSWWAYERKLWVGLGEKGTVDVPEAPQREGEPECTHGPFVPIADFFEKSSPPNIAERSFWTSFCPGVGKSWWVDGVEVFQSVNGWTDIDKQCSIGNMVWPHPVLHWEGQQREREEFPDVESDLRLDDAWNGGSCLQLGISYPPSDAEDAFFRCVYIPVQSLSVTSETFYQARLIYKVNANADLDLDFGLSVKPLAPGEGNLDIHPSAIGSLELREGWMQLSIQFKLSSGSFSKDSRSYNTLVTIGVVVAMATDDPSQASNFALSLGQLTVFPASPLPAPIHEPMVLWADFQTPSFEDATRFLSGVLTWEIAASFLPLTEISITSPEDPVPAWTIDPSESWFPSFIYFNLYFEVRRSEAFEGPEYATWIGTSGLDGSANRFVVNRLDLGVTKVQGVRLYVQGVTETGGLLPWSQCVFVDVII